MQEVQGGRVWPAANINICVCRALRPQCPLCHVIDAFHFSSFFFSQNLLKETLPVPDSILVLKHILFFLKKNRKNNLLCPESLKKYSYFTLEVC